jgi:hypothetical protein
VFYFLALFVSTLVSLVFPSASGLLLPRFVHGSPISLVLFTS